MYGCQSAVRRRGISSRAWLNTVFMSMIETCSTMLFVKRKRVFSRRLQTGEMRFSTGSSDVRISVGGTDQVEAGRYFSVGRFYSDIRPAVLLLDFRCHLGRLGSLHA